MSENRKYWLGFSIVAGIGPVRLQALIDRFGDVKSAWEAPVAALRDAGLGRKAFDNLIAARSSLDLESELKRLGKQDFSLVTMADPEYPAGLREIDSPPMVLYRWGDSQPNDQLAAAIVGTRRATPYGRAVARQVASGLAAAGVTVVSGLARGIDGEAHRAALEAGGRTIAVLGSGLDRIYPPEHRKLAEAISRSGAVLSDYPLGTRPEPGNFPPRNRIISGLALVVLIVEAGERSGALITARFAAEQGRDVFAVPGRIYDSASRGTNALIDTGAFPLLSVEAVLEVLNLDAVAIKTALPPKLPEDKAERTVLQALSDDPLHIDELGAQCELPIAELAACLSILELRGQARQVGGMHYVRVRELGGEYRVG